MIHDDVDPSGGHHITGTITGDASNTDGFVGRFAMWFGTNHDHDIHPTIVGEFANTFSGTIRNASGALVLLHAVFHVVVLPGGDLRGFVDNFSLQCLGKPS